LIPCRSCDHRSLGVLPSASRPLRGSARKLTHYKPEPTGDSPLFRVAFSAGQRMVPCNGKQMARTTCNLCAWLRAPARVRVVSINAWTSRGQGHICRLSGQRADLSTGPAHIHLRPATSARRGRESRPRYCRSGFHRALDYRALRGRLDIRPDRCQRKVPVRPRTWQLHGRGKRVRVDGGRRGRLPSSNRTWGVRVSPSGS